jgi:hypothetical protein
MKDRPKLVVTRIDYRTMTVKAELDLGPGYEKALEILGLPSDYGYVIDVEGSCYFERQDDSATLILDGSAYVVHPNDSSKSFAFEYIGLEDLDLDDALAEYCNKNLSDVDYEWRSGPRAVAVDAAYDAWKHGDFE